MSFEQKIQRLSFGLSEMAFQCDNDVISNNLAKLADKIITIESEKDLKILTDTDRSLIKWYNTQKGLPKVFHYYDVWLTKGPDDFSAYVRIERKDGPGANMFYIKGVSHYSLAMRILKRLSMDYPGEYTYPEDDKIDFRRVKRKQPKMIMRVEHLESSI